MCRPICNFHTNDHTELSYSLETKNCITSAIILYEQKFIYTLLSSKLRDIFSKYLFYQFREIWHVSRISLSWDSAFLVLFTGQRGFSLVLICPETLGTSNDLKVEDYIFTARINFHYQNVNQNSYSTFCV